MENIHSGNIADVRFKSPFTETPEPFRDILSRVPLKIQRKQFVLIDDKLHMEFTITSLTREAFENSNNVKKILDYSTSYLNWKVDSFNIGWIGSRFGVISCFACSVLFFWLFAVSLKLENEVYQVISCVSTLWLGLGFFFFAIHPYFPIAENQLLKMVVAYKDDLDA
jgi:hypothetical protein